MTVSALQAEILTACHSVKQWVIYDQTDPLGSHDYKLQKKKKQQRLRNEIRKTMLEEA